MKLIISVLDWHKQVELRHCFMMPSRIHNENNGENLVNSENMKAESPIQLFSFMLNRHWFQFEVKHLVHEHNFLQQALKIDFYTNCRVFTAIQITCQVNFSSMFPLHDLGRGGRVGFWGVRNAFLLTNGQIFRKIKAFISICQFFTDRILQNSILWIISMDNWYLYVGIQAAWGLFTVEMKLRHP